jgi:hypothetical protein
MSSFGSSASRARASALALPARQLVREAVAERLRQLHGLEQLVDAVAGIGGIPSAAVHDERLGDVLRDRQQRVEARRRILEHEPEVLAAGGTCSLTPFISTPSTRSEPPVTGVSPAIARPIVVFPDPLSPTRPTTSPGAIEAHPVDGTEAGTTQAPGVLDDEILRHDDRRRLGGAAGSCRSTISRRGTAASRRFV